MHPISVMTAILRQNSAHYPHIFTVIRRLVGINSTLNTIMLCCALKNHRLVKRLKLVRKLKAILQGESIQLNATTQ